jgi:hypothetical protein
LVRRKPATVRWKLHRDRRKIWFGKKETDSVRRKPATVRWKLHRDRYGKGNQIRIEETRN